MPVTVEVLTQQPEIADLLLAERDQMLEPQDLPGRYGRVVQSLDRVLEASGCEAVVGGRWAVWRHGYIGRVTQDVKIVLLSDQVEEFVRIASDSGFETLERSEGNCPKLRHRETSIEVDILPEGGAPEQRCVRRRRRYRIRSRWEQLAAG